MNRSCWIGVVKKILFRLYAATIYVSCYDSPLLECSTTDWSPRPLNFEQFCRRVLGHTLIREIASITTWIKASITTTKVDNTALTDRAIIVGLAIWSARGIIDTDTRIVALVIGAPTVLRVWTTSICANVDSSGRIIAGQRPVRSQALIS